MRAVEVHLAMPHGTPPPTANVAARAAMQDNSPDASRVVNRQQPDALARRAPCVFRPEAHAAAERNQVADGRRPGALVGILRHESTLLAKLAALLPETAVAHHADELLPAQVVQAQGGSCCERGGLRHGEQNPLMKPVVAVHPVRIHQQVIRRMRRVADAGEQCHCKMHVRVCLGGSERRRPSPNPTQQAHTHAVFAPADSPSAASLPECAKVDSAAAAIRPPAVDRRA